MPVFQLLLVAIIQGLTEFLPVSSSGHLILLPELTQLDDQGLAIDIAVHLGTLLAVVIYFRHDIRIAAAGLADLVRGDRQSRGARLALGLIVATIPAVIVGAIMASYNLSDALRSVSVIGWTMLIFGLVLWWADRTGVGDRDATGWTLKDALVMGLWQVLSLVPGTSRSGITITGALRLGFDRESAARLAMLMSIPVILASGVVLVAKLAMGEGFGSVRDLSLAAAFSFIAALFALTLMMRLLKSVSFTPYVVYRVALGLILLAVAYG